MLELLALALEDGWAYVRTGDVIQLARPPYHTDGLLTVAESTVEAAVTKHGFVASDKTFANWEALIAHLRQRVEETQPDSPSAQEIGQAYWEVANERDLTLALEHVEQELLPSGKYDHATRLVSAMVDHSSVLTDNGSLATNAARLLSRASRQQTGRGDG